MRYVGKSGAFISSLDHGHQFGRPSPYDAEREIRGKIEGKAIRGVDLTPVTGDLTLSFDDGRSEIICTSGGYEAYQLCRPDNLILVGRGGCEEHSEPVALSVGPDTQSSKLGIREGPASVS